jgi:hypothetical protein
MKIKVSCDLVHGTDRGGEDLFLVFRTESNNIQPANSLGLMGPILDLTKETLELELDLDEESEDMKKMIRDFHEGNQITLGWGEYDFRWVGTKGDLLEIVRNSILEPRFWSRTADEVIWRFKLTHFVDGNAD